MSSPNPSASWVRCSALPSSSRRSSVPTHLQPGLGSRLRSRWCSPRSACSRLGWIVAQYAKRIHAAGALYDYVSNGLGSTLGAAAGWLYYGGTIILTTGLGVLIGGYVHDILLPTLGVEGEILPIWAWNAVWAVALFFDPVPRRADLDPRATDARTDLGGGDPALLHQGHRGLGLGQRLRHGVRRPAHRRTAGRASCSECSTVS